MIRFVLTLAFITAQGAFAQAFEEPVIRLAPAQLDALDRYSAAKGEKAFAAGPDGHFSAQTGYLSATVAAREALKACDKEVSHPSKRCLLIDLNGEPVPPALQYAQLWRIDESSADAPVTLGDLNFDIDAWQAWLGLAGKQDYKALALSLKGPWARSWEASSQEEADREALAECNKKERAAAAPCFIARGMSGAGLSAAPDLTVAPTP